MPKTKIYESEFKKKIVRLYLDERRAIKSLNEECQLEDGTVRRWARAFCEDYETNPELNNTKELYDENRKMRRNLMRRKRKLHS